MSNEYRVEVSHPKSDTYINAYIPALLTTLSGISEDGLRAAVSEFITEKTGDRGFTVNYSGSWSA